ncbi:MAG: hypothetical protein MK171_03385 [Pirellulales bacterium]|nr:hypothetical protein [Pirellulales bacterium]
MIRILFKTRIAAAVTRKVGWPLVSITLAIVLLAPAHLRAHTVGDVEELRFVGYAAPFGNTGATTYTDVWADGDYGFIGSLESGVAILDVSGSINPALPVGTFVPASPQQFYDIKAKDGYGYFSSLDGGGTFVVDVQDPTSAFTAAQIDSVLGGHNNVRNTAISGDYLYQMDDASALIHVFDVSTPSLPAFVRTVNTGDSVGVYDATVIGTRMYASGLGGVAGEGAVYVYDISNQSTSAPVLLGQVPTGANTASAWPTSDASYLMATHREVGGALGIWDISDLSQTFLVSSADASDLEINSYSTSEVTVLDDIVYVAWWEAGVQVLDLDNDVVNNGVQLIGQFDTSNDSSPLDGYVGNQSVYPLLGHGKVLLSDTKWGFCVVSAEFVLPPDPNNGDFDGDGDYDGADFLVWQGGYGLSSGAMGTDGDADADGNVDGDDYLAWWANFSSPAAFLSQSSTTIPEPSTILLVAVCCMTMVLTRPAPTKRRNRSL